MRINSKIVLMAFIAACFLFACNEEVNAPGTEQSGDDESLKHIDARSELNSVAPYLYKEVDNRHEAFGRIVYRHLKYAPTTDPVELFPEFKREEMRNLYARLEADYGKLDIRATLDKARSEKLLDEPAYNLTKKFFDDFLVKMESTNESEEVWNYLLDYEQNLKDDKSSELARELLLGYSAMLRHYVKYNFELGEFSRQAAKKLPNGRVAGIDCVLGIKVSCWVDQAGIAIVAGVAASVAGIINPAAGGIVWASIVNAGLAATASQFIKGVGSAYANSACGCGSSLPACTAPTAMRLIIGDCGDVHSWQIVGGGTSPSFFSYTVQNGVFPEFNDNVNIGQTLNKLVTVRQLNMSQNVIVTSVVHCTDGSQYALANSFNVNAVKNGVADIVFTGATYVPVNDTERYYVYGTSQVSNGKLTYQFSKNFAGQIVQSGPDYVDIRWTIALNYPPYAMAYCNVVNGCSGAVSNKYVQVTTY